MSGVTIHVSTAHGGEGWCEHLASRLSSIHAGAHVRVSEGAEDDVFVWMDEMGDVAEGAGASCDECAPVGADAGERGSLDRVISAADDLAARVLGECRVIRKAWGRSARRTPYPLRAWLFALVGACTSLATAGCSTDTFLYPDGGDPGDAQTDAAVESGRADADAAVDGPVTVDASTDSAEADAHVQAYRRVFITSGDYSANFGGSSGADSTCGSVATGAGLGGTWAAWLSTSTSSAASRLEHASVPYQLLDGTVVANDWTGLASGSLLHAIDRDEHNTLVLVNETTAPFSGVAWTGTAPDGTTLAGCNSSSGCTCANWTEGSDSYAGSFGLGSSTNSSWTEENYLYVCGQQYSLYCIEQP